jgi:hypothetical protein
MSQTRARFAVLLQTQLSHLHLSGDCR